MTEPVVPGGQPVTKPGQLLPCSATLAVAARQSAAGKPVRPSPVHRHPPLRACRSLQGLVGNRAGEDFFVLVSSMGMLRLLLRYACHRDPPVSSKRVCGENRG